MIGLIKENIYLFLFNALYVAGFTFYYVSIRNLEFLWYVLVLVGFLILIGATLQRTHFPKPLLWGLSIWGLLHMAGGGVVVQGEVLYAFKLISLWGGNGEATILKYDQVVHFYGFFISTFVIHHLLKPHLLSGKEKLFGIVLIAGLSSMGLSVVNEIVEFLAVVLISETGVGGYFNIALDLVFNTLGALVAACFIYFREKGRAVKSF